MFFFNLLTKILEKRCGKLEITLYVQMQFIDNTSTGIYRPSLKIPLIIQKKLINCFLEGKLVIFMIRIIKQKIFIFRFKLRKINEQN
jgi:hypothetical protein